MIDAVSSFFTIWGRSNIYYESLFISTFYLSMLLFLFIFTVLYYNSVDRYC